MTEVKILELLKQPLSCSRFIKRLNADSKIPTITDAVKLVEGGDDAKKSGFHTPRSVSKGSHFAYCIPSDRKEYKQLLTNDKALKEFNLAPDDDLKKILDGEKVYYDTERGIFPYSSNYSGFQFGQFAGQLGDGRVVNLFDLKDMHGNWQTLQIKGSGLTPFSRFADGKAVVRSSIREFIISESLHAIGIPSTRALQLTLLPSTKARRGASMEMCANYCRFSPSWIRLGHFDTYRWKFDLDSMVRLSDYVIEEVFKEKLVDIDLNIFTKDYFPEDEGPTNDTMAINSKDCTKYDGMFRKVVTSNAECVAYWQAYGFLNGVLNTDNTSIMGLSMDYGPFSFMDRFDPTYTPNHDDSMKRYSFSNQPGVIWWNLLQFGQAISVLLGAGKHNLKTVLSAKDISSIDPGTQRQLLDRVNSVIGLSANEYKYTFTKKYCDLMAMRLGIDLQLPSEISEESVEVTARTVKEFLSTVVEPLLDLISHTKIDYNNFFLNLQKYNGSLSSEDGFLGLDPAYVSIFFDKDDYEILDDYFTRGANKTSDTRALLEQLQSLVSWTDVYKQRLHSANRREIATAVNPQFIPRSWIFEEVIDDITRQLRDADTLDLSGLQKLFKMSANPYNNQLWDEELRPDLHEKWQRQPQESQLMKQASCSS
ncbi:hypothetical protein RNJ44_02525 [Nakaseomyces bracarensis]|uniref:Selenoprotein O n=1 Tax=Nakaseomyces bracarensis TaxID=273131 RepID=A0ABR4NLZ9_9SACH